MWGGFTLLTAWFTVDAREGQNRSTPTKCAGPSLCVAVAGEYPTTLWLARRGAAG